jgi:hypothetical protein
LNYTASIGYRLLAGAFPPNQSQVVAIFFSAAGGFLTDPRSIVPAATAALQRGAASGVAPATAAYCQPIWRVLANPGTVVDFTMRFYAANVEQGIGHARPLLQRNVPEVVSNIGDLDTDALLAHVGSGDGFVTTWYDQSGNGRHATQATATLQPRIVNFGAIETQNGRATVVQTATDQSLSISSAFTGMTSATGVFVFRQLTGNGGAHDFKESATNLANNSPLSDGKAYDQFFSASRQEFNNYGPASTSSTNTLTTHTARQTGTALQLFKNGTQIDGDKTVNFQAPGGRSLFAANALGTVTLSEAIVFGTAISTTYRQLIERNQGAYYNITITH